MESGFESAKDLLDVVAIPVALAVLAAVWPAVEGYYRRRRFQRLTRRELSELAPFPDTPRAGQSWKSHVRKGLVHKAIVEAPSDNRDFLLSLSPTFTYYISQLWCAYQEDNTEQWLHYLGRLSKWSYVSRYRTKIETVTAHWRTLIDAYKSPLPHKPNSPRLR